MKIFDLYCDTFTELYDRSLSLDNKLTAVNTDGLSLFCRAVQCFAVFLHPEASDRYRRYREVSEYGKNELLKCGIPTVLSAEELDLNGVSAMLSLEGGVPGFTPDDVEMLYADGIRTVSLTWNFDNPLAGGAFGESGLTVLGRQVIAELNRFNMCTDLSHLNDKSFFEAAEYANFCLATHSGVESTVKHRRCLGDACLKVIKEKRGLVGLTVYPEFIGLEPYEGFYKAAVHCLELGLEDNIALGTDFDGAEMSQSLAKTADLAELYRYLCDRGLGKRLCDKIFFENQQEFYRNVLTK